MAYKQIRRRMKQDVAENEGATHEVSHASDVSQIQTDRELMTADDALALQDVVGNQATGKMMGAASTPPPPRLGYVQPKAIPPQPLRPGGSLDAPAYAHLQRKPMLQRALGSKTPNILRRSQAPEIQREKTPEEKEVGRAEMKTTFMARIRALKTDIPELATAMMLESVAETIWNSYTGGVMGTSGLNKETPDGPQAIDPNHPLDTSVPETKQPGHRAERHNDQTNPATYSNSPGHAALTREDQKMGEYQTNMSEAFNVLTLALKSISQSQFKMATRYGFWNGHLAKATALANTDILSLEGSAIGKLFDDIGGYQAGDTTAWDSGLWPALSRAFAGMVRNEILNKDNLNKEIIVFCGTDFSNPTSNIWASNEIKTLFGSINSETEELIREIMDSRITYYAVSHDLQDTVNGVKGVHYSSKDPAAIKEAQQTKYPTNHKPARI